VIRPTPEEEDDGEDDEASDGDEFDAGEPLEDGQHRIPDELQDFRTCSQNSASPKNSTAMMFRSRITMRIYIAVNWLYSTNSALFDAQ